jgi:hypothetical protein
MRRKENQKESDNADEIIMIEIIGFIDELDIGERKEKHYCRNPIEQSKQYEKRRNENSCE